MLHAITTHPLTNNTLPDPLQKTKLDILSLPPLLFDKGFIISKLTCGSLEWESALLQIFGSSGESDQNFCGESSSPQPLCYRQLLRPPNSLGRTSAGPKKDFAPCHRHPPANKYLTPSPANIPYSLIEHSTSPITLEV